MSTVLSQENVMSIGMPLGQAVSLSRRIEPSRMNTLTRPDDSTNADAADTYADASVSTLREFGGWLTFGSLMSDSLSYATLFMEDSEAPLNQWFWGCRTIDQYRDEVSISDDHEEKMLLHVFAKGGRGLIEPNQDTVSMAYRILHASFATEVKWREIVCSENDGTLMFELELPSGKSIDAELEADGRLNASTFYENDVESSTEYWLDITEQEFLDLIRSEDKCPFPSTILFVDSYGPVKISGVPDTIGPNQMPSRTTTYQYGT